MEKIEIMGWRRIAQAPQQPTAQAQKSERRAGEALLMAIGIDPVSGERRTYDRVETSALSADELEALEAAGVGVEISGRWASAKTSSDAPQSAEVSFAGARPIAYTVDEVLLGEHAPVWVIPEEGDDVRILLTPA